VLQGTAKMKTSHPIQFDGRATTVQVAYEVHPDKRTDCPAGRSRPGRPVPIDVVIQGDVDGGRANLSPLSKTSLNQVAGRHRNHLEFKNGSPAGGSSSHTPKKIDPAYSNWPAAKEAAAAMRRLVRFFFSVPGAVLW